MLFNPTTAWSARVLLPYLIVWASLKLPALFAAPKIEGVWLGFGELAMLLAGGWVLFARLAALPEGSPLAVYSRRLAENTGRVLRARLPGVRLR